MTRLKLSALAFGVAATAALAFGRPAAAETEATCVPEACDLAGGPAICCLIGTGSMTCSPCGSSKPVTLPHAQ